MAGLQTSTAALTHIAGFDALPPAGLAALPAADPAAMMRWAPEIRALLLQTQFLHQLGWAHDAASDHVSVTWAQSPIWEAARPTAATMARQAGLVRNYIDQRADRSAEILSQLGDFGAYFGIILGLSNPRNAKTYELMAHVQALAGQATMMVKHLIACRRPDEVDARIAPLIPTPGHGAYPSAHATQVFAMAEVLASLLRAAPTPYADVETRIGLTFRQAHRIAVNRTVAGVHFPMDSAAGAVLGLQVGRALVGMMTGKTRLKPKISLDANAAPDKDFLFAELAPELAPSGAARATAPDPLFAWIWAQAKAEFV